jgi:hypothetical protein
MVRRWIKKTLKIPVLKKALSRALPSSAAGLFIVKFRMKDIQAVTASTSVDVDVRGLPIRESAHSSRSLGAYSGVRPADLKIGPPPMVASFANVCLLQRRP